MTFLSPTKTASPFIPLSPSPFVHPSSNLCFIFLRFDMSFAVKSGSHFMATVVATKKMLWCEICECVFLDQS